CRAGAPSAFARAASAADHAAQSGGEGHFFLPLRGFRARGLRAASAHQGRGGGVSAPPPSIELVLLAAVADDGVIGRDDRLPWRLASDLKRFKALTMGKPVVMGRK